MDWLPLYLSAKLALVTTVILIILTAPLAYILAFCRFPGKTLVEALVNLPVVLPPTVLGFYLLIYMGPQGALGRLWEACTGTSLIFTFPGIVLASLLYSLPFAVQPMRAAFEKLDRRLLESAHILGLYPVATFFRVVLPNARGGLIASAILVFAHTLGEFGVILMVGGSIPGKTKVASIAIFEAVEALRYREAMILSLTLIPVCYLILLLVNLLNRKSAYGS
ncbi:MAG: molybdate ABC transporter permease subunit [Desulfobacca sp.]|nr:molybdate ABC transporter permease subunit [Desulfobacca sp.]